MRRDTPHQESNGDGAQEQLHQSMGRIASGRRTQGQEVSPPRPGSSSPVVTCETCRQAVSEEFAVKCSGCNYGDSCGVPNTACYWKSFLYDGVFQLHKLCNAFTTHSARL